MNQSSEFWYQQKIKLGRQISQVIDTALACEPVGGMTPQWQNILAQLGVCPLNASQKESAILAHQQTKGAVIDEVKNALEIINQSLLQQLPDAKIELASFLKDFPQRQINHYTTLATVKPKVSGGMFSFAMETAAEKSKQGHADGGTYLLKCPQCGGPRMNVQCLVCEFCGGKTTQ